MAQADVEQLARMLTAAQRGERFCDGWWLRVLDSGWLWSVVDRLEQLVAGDATVSDGPAGADDDA